MLILGIDPGSRKTGYGIIKQTANHYEHIISGCIKTEDSHFPTRIHTIFQGIQQVIQTYQPQVAALEKVFVHINPDSALKLGQARGAVIVAIMSYQLPLHEYAATEVKNATTGNGHASKDQVQFMVKRLLNLAPNNKLQEDSADALACALCHAFRYRG